MTEWRRIVINKTVYPYEISNSGVVRNMSKKIIKPFVRGKNKGNYYAVDLYINGKRKRIDIQRIVAIAFLPNPENKPEVNHLDLNHFNNSIENLEWCTRSENMCHAVFMRGWFEVQALYD